MQKTRIKKPMTITDIARRAGVAVSTISRVLNDHPDVSPKTKERIRGLLKRYHYRPHARARGLVQKSTKTICFCFGNRSFLEPFHARILEGVADFCRAQHHSVIFMPYFYDFKTPADRFQLPNLIWERGAVDGVIIAGANSPNFIRAVQSLHIPFAVFGNNVIGRKEPFSYDAVYFDEQHGVGEATKHLLRLGHRNIGFIGNTTLPWFSKRHASYSDTMLQAGLQPRVFGDPLAVSGIAYGKSGMAALNAADPSVTAVVAGDDEIACGVMHWAHAQKASVPGDLSVVGFDDIEPNEFLAVGLTTVAVPRAEVGAELARLLFAKLNSPGTKCKSVMLPTQLVVRESTSEPRC